MRRLRVVLAVAVLVGCEGSTAGNGSAQRNDGVAVASDAGGKELTAADALCGGDSVTLGDGSRTCGWFRDAELIGELITPQADTFLLVSGWNCTDCDAEQEIILRKRGVGRSAWRETSAGDFSVPGIVTDYQDESVVVADTRLFWGVCSDAAAPVVIQVDSLRKVGADSVWLVVAQPSGDSVAGRDAVEPRSTLTGILARVAGGDCHEVPRRNRSSTP